MRAESVPWPKFQGRIALVAAPSATDNAPFAGWNADFASARVPPMRSVALLGDYYLLDPSSWSGMRGGLRATSGLYAGLRSGATQAGAWGLPNGHGLSVARRLGANVDNEPFATLPYVGLGYTGLSSGGGLSFSADIGVVARQPGSGLRFGRNAGGASLDDVLRDVRLTPMIQLGVSYAF